MRCIKQKPKPKDNLKLEVDLCTMPYSSSPKYHCLHLKSFPLCPREAHTIYFNPGQESHTHAGTPMPADTLDAITLLMPILNSSFVSAHLTNQYFGHQKEKALIVGLRTHALFQWRACLFPQGSYFCLGLLVEIWLLRGISNIFQYYIKVDLNNLRSLPFYLLWKLCRAGIHPKQKLHAFYMAIKTAFLLRLESVPSNFLLHLNLSSFNWNRCYSRLALSSLSSKNSIHCSKWAQMEGIHLGTAPPLSN